jgi:hypothetical protein
MGGIYIHCGRCGCSSSSLLPSSIQWPLLGWRAESSCGCTTLADPWRALLSADQWSRNHFKRPSLGSNKLRSSHRKIDGRLITFNWGTAAFYAGSEKLSADHRSFEQGSAPSRDHDLGTLIPRLLFPTRDRRRCSFPSRISHLQPRGLYVTKRKA